MILLIRVLTSPFYMWFRCGVFGCLYAVKIDM